MRDAPLLFTPNPYAPPAVPARPDSPAVLYTHAHVILASLSGSPIAGAILLALNAHRLGRPRSVALRALCLGGLASSAALVAVPILLPNLTIPFFLASLFATGYAARALQDDALDAHVVAGGPIGSRWAALGVGVACSAVIAALAAAIMDALYYVRIVWPAA